jgi:polyphosphate kinase 2 (PPK2 family)
VAIFDRSWYGRVLVERVEGYCSEADWMRAYAEINDFEDQLVSAGTIVLKFWLSVSSDEQLRVSRRGKRRPSSVTRSPRRIGAIAKMAPYEPAVCDMIDRTSTENAAWTLVEADNKYFARVKILTELVDKLEVQSEMKDI